MLVDVEGGGGCRYWYHLIYRRMIARGGNGMTGHKNTPYGNWRWSNRTRRWVAASGGVVYGVLAEPSEPELLR